MKRRTLGIALAVAMVLVPLAAMGQGKAAPDEMTGTVKVGDKAPSFTLKDQNGEERSLESLIEGDGLTAVVFFRSANW